MKPAIHMNSHTLHINLNENVQSQIFNQFFSRIVILNVDQLELNIFQIIG